MTMASIATAANDTELQARVLATAQREMVFNEALASTNYGKQLRSIPSTISITPGSAYTNLIMPLMWRVAIDTEAAYATALQAGRGAPGHDTDIITDAALTSAVVAGWPQDEPTAAATLTPMMSSPPSLSVQNLPGSAPFAQEVTRAQAKMAEAATPTPAEEEPAEEEPDA